MDKSNLQESYIRQSYVFPNANNTSLNRSFISTALVNDSFSYGDDLRKSQIQNLPNYRKINLGQTPNFIIVFQAIEIERLSNEVEVLRVRLKQYQRQIFNAQNYQVQIRELTEKCFAYQRQRQQYREQLDKLNKICETLYHQNQMLKDKLNDIDISLKQKYQSEKNKNIELTQQIDKWKARYQAAEKSKAKQLEDLRNLMECQRKSMIDREIRQITIRFQTERSNLQNQIRKCRQLLENRSRQIQDYKQKCQRYQINLMELRNYQNIIADNQNKIVILNQQLIRINQVLKNKQDQLQNTKQKEYKLNQLIKDQKEWQYQNQQLKANLDNKNKQIQQWRVRFSRLEDQNIRGKQLQHYNNQLANKIQLASKQIDRLNNVLKIKLQEIQQWKKKFTDKQIQVSKYKNLQNDVYGYKSKFDMIQTENDRVNGILKTRLAQIEDWKTKYIKLEQNINNFLIIEKDKKAMEQKFNKQIKLTQQLEYELSKAQKQINNLRNYENQAKDYQRKNFALNKQVDRLNGIIRNHSQQLQDYKSRFNKLENTLNQYRNIQSKTKDYQTKIILQTQQIQRLNTLIRNKNDDISQLEKEKLQIHQKMSHYKNYQIKISQYQQNNNRLEDQIKLLKKDIQNWQNRFKQSDLRSRQLQNHLFVNTQQKEKLSGIIKNKNNQYENLRSKYSSLEDNLKKINQLEIVCQDQYTKLMAVNSDLERFQRSNKTLQDQIQSQKNINNQFAYKIIVLSAQIERITKNGGNQKNLKQVQQIKELFSQLSLKFKSKNNQIQILTNKISYLQNQISQLKLDYTRLLRQAQSSFRQNVTLLKKIDQYQDYARRIHILSAQIDRLTLQNKSLDEDAKRMRLKYADNIALEKKEEGYNLTKLLMAVQIQSLRNRLNQRQMSLQEMRKSILQPVRRI